MTPGCTPAKLSSLLARGLLSFPVTHFCEDLTFDEEAFRSHCSWLLERDFAALFAAGGTGEFFSLTFDELRRVVAASVEEAGGRVPVVAGCGYGTSMAVDLARQAERLGTDGLLLLPPYLVAPSQEGLARHVDAVCKATGLGVIVYNRDNAVLDDSSLARLCDRNPNLVAFKDGVGDLELLARIVARMGDRLTYIGGMPTAETFAAPYLAAGATTYSSAIFNFLPDWALGFYKAVRAGDRERIDDELRRFVIPYAELRNRRRGYAVSIVKAGMRAVGRPAGPVRAPLVDLSQVEQDGLRTLVESLLRRPAV